jgi:hypothetical protein
MSDFFNWLRDIILDIQRFFSDAYEYLISLLKIMTYELMTFFINLFSGVIDTMIVDSGVLGTVASAWQTLPSNIRGLATAFNLPEAFGIIILAYVVRFAIRRIPIIG